MNDWCRWNNEADAQKCLDTINGSKYFPFTVIDEITKVSAVSSKQKTLRWDFLTKCEDGKFGFQKPDADMLKKLELDETIFEGSKTEPYDSSWHTAEKS